MVSKPSCCMYLSISVNQLSVECTINLTIRCVVKPAQFIVYLMVQGACTACGLIFVLSLTLIISCLILI